MKNNRGVTLTSVIIYIIGMAIDGGVEAFAMNYYQNIDREKVQFDFFVESTSKTIDKEKIEALGGRVIIIPHYTHLFKYIKELKQLYDETQKYSIILPIRKHSKRERKLDGLENI